MSDILNTGDIDPEIADLLGDDSSPVSVPDFSDLFDDGIEAPAADPEKASQVEDISRENFPSIVRWDQDPDPVFFEKDFYSRLLTGEGEISKRIHTLLQKFLKCEDPQERGVYRQRLIPAYWDLARNLTHNYRATMEKRLTLRFGYILPTLVSVEQRKMLSKIVSGDEYGEPIHYVDEWLDLVLEGSVNPLASDEVKPSKMSNQNKTKAQMEKAQGSKEANLIHLKNLIAQRDSIDGDLNAQIRNITRHDPHPVIPGIKTAYSGDQKTALNRAAELLRRLNRMDKDIHLNIDKLKDAEKDLAKLGDKLQELGGMSKADKGVMESELDNVRQIAKMCVGRQGNHLPFLMKNFFFPNIDLIGTRENVIRYMDQIEQVDSGIFRRTFRQKTNRIVPHTIIVPCYGDKGVCWEPFERFNRATSRGRIGIPMFPKSLKMAVIYALGDLRWNVAKERAAHYWMEEGLTGHYYQWFSAHKMRGDVRLRFLEDYVLWVTKEVDGVQKLDKEVRGIFWRHIPFAQPVKDTLRNRGFVYNELYKKDMNKAASDGY